MKESEEGWIIDDKGLVEGDEEYGDVCVERERATGTLCE